MSRAVSAQSLQKTMQPVEINRTMLPLFERRRVDQDAPTVFSDTCVMRTKRKTDATKTPQTRAVMDIFEVTNRTTRKKKAVKSWATNSRPTLSCAQSIG